MIFTIVSWDLGIS